jgi:predicted small metal-binding protein
MADDKTIHCDCGYRLHAGTERNQVAEVRRHAREVHGIAFSIEEALAVLLRLELDERASAHLTRAEDTTQGREQR